MKEYIEYFIKNILNKRKNAYLNTLLKHIFFEPVENKKPKDITNITFVIPGMRAHNGGLTSILRLGTYLAEFGYVIKYICYNEQTIEEMEKNASINLENYKGSFLDKSYLLKIDSDIVVATYWESVYYMRDMKGYKMYFIQDYEPLFFIYGEKYILAQKTYELGYHMVSLGKWNKFMIEKNCVVNSKIDCIDFPYEKSEYSAIERDFDSYKNKKELDIAVYIKFEEKRAPHLVQEILGNIINEFEKQNIKINVYYYGADKSMKLKNGINLGKLNKDELINLYMKCHFGMVASLTNISLVPFEMIACKLPVVEFKEGTFKYFFDQEDAILTSFDWSDLYEKLSYYLINTDALKNMTEGATHKLEKLSWKSSARQFEAILKQIIDK
ncbi:MAG: glycosyltransferase [Bacillota bacterium]|nr:glycosyltransferase [Bacillota bacterium]